eukprot:791232-Prorocentrum_minimum.AAC.1
MGKPMGMLILAESSCNTPYYTYLTMGKPMGMLLLAESSSVGGGDGSVGLEHDTVRSARGHHTALVQQVDAVHWAHLGESNGSGGAHSGNGGRSRGVERGGEGFGGIWRDSEGFGGVDKERL